MSNFLAILLLKMFACFSFLQETFGGFKRPWRNRRAKAAAKAGEGLVECPDLASTGVRLQALLL